MMHCKICGKDNDGTLSEKNKKRVCVECLSIQISCGCGCGSLRSKYDKQGRVRIYMNGHCSEETKLKMSEAQRGEKHHLWGKHRTEESKRRMSESRKGKKRSPHSEFTKKKMSIKALNRKPNFNPKTTEPIVSAYLDEIKEEHTSQKNIDGIARVDEYLLRIKGIIQVDGCYFHGCLIHRPTCMKYKMVRDKVEKDKIQDAQLIKLGYKILRIWEHDINNGKYKQLINDFVNK